MTDVRLVDIANEVDKPVSSLLREVISCNFQVLVPLKDLVDQRERAAKNLPKSLRQDIFSDVYSEQSLRKRYKFFQLICQFRTFKPEKLPNCHALSSKGAEKIQIREFEQINQIQGWKKLSDDLFLENYIEENIQILTNHLLKFRGQDLQQIAHFSQTNSAIDSENPKIIWFPFAKFEISKSQLLLGLREEEQLRQIFGSSRKKKNKNKSEPIIPADCDGFENKMNAGILSNNSRPLRDLLFKIATNNAWEKKKRLEKFWGAISGELRKEKSQNRSYDRQQVVLLQWAPPTVGRKIYDRIFIWRDAQGKERKCSKKTLENHLSLLAKYYPEFRDN